MEETAQGEAMRHFLSGCLRSALVMLGFVAWGLACYAVVVRLMGVA